MLGFLATVAAAVAVLVCAALAFVGVLFWRAARRNLTLAQDASPRGHLRRVVRYNLAPPPVALAAVPTVTDSAAVVVWTTARPVPTRVRIGPADGSLHAYTASTEPARCHAVRLEGLVPETRYRVQLGVVDGGAPVLEFATLPDVGPIRFRFATVTDTHFKRDSWTWPDGRLYRHGRATQERLRAGMLRHAPAFIIHKGDISEPPGARRMRRYGELMADTGVALHAIPGNHDYYAHPDFPGDWRVLAGTDATYHSFAHEDVHFVLLDTSWTGEQERGFFGATQLRWLRDDLRAHRDVRTVIVTHHPVFGGAEENRVCHDAAAFCDVVRAHPRVVAVLSGHVHRNLVRWDDRLPGVPNVETCSGIQYPIGFALYEVGERGLRQSFHMVDDGGLWEASWARSWLRAVTNPSEPLGHPAHRNFVIPWPDAH